MGKTIGSLSSNTLGASNSATLVTDPVSPLALAPEQTIQSEPSPSGNSSVEVTPEFSQVKI